MHTLWNKITIVSLLISLGMFPVSAQDNVGLPYLKIGVGPRQAGMGNVFTGVGDDVYTMQWNPGGLGHIRRWQWSAAYNRWFADVYQASLLGAKQFRFIGTRKATLGFFCSYLGMPEWDSTEGAMPSVTANHLTAGISIGQRMDWIHEALSIGATVKGIRSQLADYEANAFAMDAGILIKPKRFHIENIGFGLFEYGILTLGASVLNVGPSVTFDQDETQLPMTMRFGAGWRMGKYDGWSVLLASDLDKVEGRDWTTGVAGEIWWKEILGARIGYRMNDANLGDFTFGFGIRWDDVMDQMLGLPTRYGDAFEINLAGVDYGEVLDQTYRGAVSHYSVAPEPFNLKEPDVVVSQVLGISSMVDMSWEETIDPDPFDEVNYLLLLDMNKKHMNQAVRQVQYDMDAFLASSLKDSLMLVDDTGDTKYTTAVNKGGVYYWAVIAYDLAHHVRLAKRGESYVGEFVVATADLLVKDFSFTPSPWITTTPEQGTIRCTLGNAGNAPSGPFDFEMLVHPPDAAPGVADTITALHLSGLSAGEDTVLAFDWQSSHNGTHVFSMTVDPDSLVNEINRENNSKHKSVVSIPKGVLYCPDVVEVMATGFDSTEVPIVPEVYFDSLSSVVMPVYYQKTNVFLPVLEIFAERLEENPDVDLKILGSIDHMSGEKDLSLAVQRAENVKLTLMDLGIPESRLHIVEDHPEKILGDKPDPPDPQDGIWIRQQNRAVQFQVPQASELAIFGPIKVAVDTTLRDSVYFDVHVHSPGAVKEYFIEGGPNDILITQNGLVNHLDIFGNFLWDGTNFKKKLVPRNHYYHYQFVLVDSLNRTFRTYPDSVYLREKRTIRRREVFGAAKFAQTEPVYQFYWDKLMEIAKDLVENPNMRVRFEGHACVIGSQEINKSLSSRRAARFTEAFKERIRTYYPNQYQSVVQRIDPPIGYGENEPLTVKLRELGEVLLGDNDTPVGRYMNRRIMVLLYREN